MKHSFRLKKSQLRSVFSGKMNFKTLSIDNKNDVENAINTLLIFTELEDKLNFPLAFELPKKDSQFNYN